jgi:peptidoglycan/xylan/chitin deacetylase (PgdA/CDA1 family)
MPPQVALTFDDGPDPKYTPRLLDILAGLDVTATFFFVGRRAEQHPEIVLRALEDGHAIGSHTYAHIPASQLDRHRLLEEIRAGREVIEQVTGQPCVLFRPPRGEVTLELARIVRRLDLQTWLWSVDTRDFLAATTVQDILVRVSRVEHGGSLLLHDGLADEADGSDPNRSRTLTAVPEIIDLLHSKGLSPGPLIGQERRLAKVWKQRSSGQMSDLV